MLLGKEKRLRLQAIPPLVHKNVTTAYIPHLSFRPAPERKKEEEEGRGGEVVEEEGETTTLYTLEDTREFKVHFCQGYVPLWRVKNSEDAR